MRKDILQERAKARNEKKGGPDFYGAFWGDAKKHAVGDRDLHAAVAYRIARNPGRKRLYEQLRDGFLNWWNNKRRWTNEPFRAIDGPHTKYELDSTTLIKIENVLAVKDAHGLDHYVYPYFSQHAALTAESARMCLWVLNSAFPNLQANELRVLDVLRGEVFSLDRTPLEGTEEGSLREKLARVRIRRRQLRDEYDFDE